jgi:hypothetical protein
MQDPDGPKNLTEDERNPAELEQDEVFVLQPQHYASALDEISEDPRYGGFPVHIFPTEGKQVLDPPCKVCGNLDTANFPASHTIHEGIRIRLLEDVKLDQLEEGSGSGCLSCALIRAICQSYEGNKTLCRFEYNPQDAGTPGLTIKIQQDYRTTVKLEICATEGTACPLPSVLHRPLNWNSNIACRQISQWLDGCSSGHDCYDVSSFPVLPTRLLEIQGPRQVRVYLSGANERASYACLSHCWGGVVPLKLLQATLREFQQKIPWDRLPRTFKDAIEVARGLNIKFLWIDSLCIVQDDDNDWRRESSMMASVYSQSYITLAASQAADSTQGLFVDPKLAMYKKVYIGFSGQGKRHELFVRHGPQLFDRAGLPLLRRAWFFQEEVLSSRTVHFTESFLYLGCHQGAVLADQKETHRISYCILSLAKNSVREGACPNLWHKIASKYSEFSLTNPQDVFPALQGIAKKVQATRQCDYFAGIWGDSVIKDLLWWKLDEATNLNPLQYLAPTWSWASQPGRVYWQFEPVNSKYRPDAVCISISTRPVGDDPLGEVISGELQLQGYCLSAVLIQNEDKPHKLRINLKDNSFCRIRWCPDVNPCQLPDKNVTIIYIGMCISSHVWLVLMRMSMEREEYRRVGIIWVSGGPLREANDFRDICVDRGERKIVTII